jgi:hypothetical protein
VGITTALPVFQHFVKVSHHLYHLKESKVNFQKGAKTTQWGKDNLKTNGTRKTGYPHAKEGSWR